MLSSNNKKLLTGFGVAAALAVLTSFAGLTLMNKSLKQLNPLIEESSPTLISLAELEAHGERLIAEANANGIFVLSRMRGTGDSAGVDYWSATIDERRQRFEDAMLGFQQWYRVANEMVLTQEERKITEGMHELIEKIYQEGTDLLNIQFQGQDVFGDVEARIVRIAEWDRSFEVRFQKIIQENIAEMNDIHSRFRESFRRLPGHIYLATVVGSLGIVLIGLLLVVVLGRESLLSERKMKNRQTINITRELGFAEYLKKMAEQIDAIDQNLGRLEASCRQEKDAPTPSDRLDERPCGKLCDGLEAVQEKLKVMREDHTEMGLRISNQAVHEIK